MRKVSKIDNIVLNYPLYISTEFDVDNYIGKKSIAIDGSSVMFVQAKGALSNEVEVSSNGDAWVHETIKDQLMTIVDENEKVITYTDGTTDTFHFDHTKLPLSFKPIYNGALWYNVTINLLKG